MPLTLIKGGTVYDPANNIDGQVRDLWIQDGKFVNAPSNPNAEVSNTINAAGYVVMPGGVDMHCHIAGPKVNAARRFIPEQNGRVVPSAPATGRLFAGLGYTTAMDAAIPGLMARLAHAEFKDTPIIDKGFLTLFGNNHYVMDHIRSGNQEAVTAYCAWAMSAVKGYGIKIVNPGGVENWKQINRMAIRELDQPVPEFDVTPRQILQSLSQAADDLQLPHAVHVHCNNLGMPGNWETTLETMKSLEGRRAHFAHIQFHSYAGDENDGGSFSSAVDNLLDYVHQHENVTLDVGHVTPGEAVSITGDAPFSEHLHQLTGGKWFSADTEQESSCGVIPGEYKPFKSLIHSVQWAISLEWYLRMEDPWRIAMSSDHPNGGAFVKYPEIIALLMDSAHRNEMMSRMPEELQQRSSLGSITREYTLNDICIITRAAPAKILGLKNKGHLGIGADADLTIYLPQDDKQAMFQRPKWVIKSGDIIAEDGELKGNPLLLPVGETFFTSAEYDNSALTDLPEWFAENYSVRFANYTIDEEELVAG